MLRVGCQAWLLVADEAHWVAVHGFNQARVSGGAEGLGAEPSLGDRGEASSRVRLLYGTFWKLG